MYIPAGALETVFVLQSVMFPPLLQVTVLPFISPVVQKLKDFLSLPFGIHIE